MYQGSQVWVGRGFLKSCDQVLFDSMIKATPRTCARGKVIHLLAQKRPDLDFQALQQAVMNVENCKKNGLSLAKN